MLTVTRVEAEVSNNLLLTGRRVPSSLSSDQTWRVEIQYHHKEKGLTSLFYEPSGLYQAITETYESLYNTKIYDPCNGSKSAKLREIASFLNPLFD